MPLVLIDFFSPGGLDGFDMHQVAGFTDQITLGRSTILDDDDPLEVDAEIGDPFLHGFFNTGIKAFQTDLIATTVLVRAFEFFLGWLDRPLGHIKAVHELAGQQRNIGGDGHSVNVPVRKCGPIDITLHNQDDLGFYPAAATGIPHGGLEKVK